MPQRMRTTCIVACLSLLSAWSPQRGVSAGERKEAVRDEPARTDRYRDPLPPGAFLRLGTVRLRHALDVTGVAFAPDGKTVFAAANDVRRWDLATGKNVAPAGLPRESPWAFAVGRSADRRTVVATISYDTIHLHDGDTGRALRSIGKAGIALYAVALSPDCSVVASAWGGAKVKLFETRTGEGLREMSCGGQALGLAFSADGRLLAAGCGETARVWEVTTGKEVGSFSGPGINVRRVAFSPDGKALFVGGIESTVFQWDIAARQRVRDFVHEAGVNALALSPDGKTLVTGAQDGVARLWDAANGKLVRALGGPGTPVVAVAFSPDGKTLACAQGPAVRLWDVATGRDLHPPPGHVGGVGMVAVSPDGKTVASGERGGAVLLWDAATGKVRHRLPAPRHPVRWLDFTAGGKTLAGGGFRDAVTFWDVESGKIARTLDRLPGIGRPVDVAADGRTLAVGDHLAVVVCDAQTGKERRRLEGHPRPVRFLRYSPDSRRLVSLDDGGWVLIWDAATGKEVRRFSSGFGWSLGLTAVAHPAHTLSFSPDGRWLAFFEERTGTIDVWELATGKRCHRWKGEDYVAWQAVFSPDGRTVAVQESRGKAVRLRSLATGAVFARLEPAPIGLDCVAWTPDGKAVVTGRSDGTVMFWRAPAAPTAARDLSAVELKKLWEQLGGEDAVAGLEAVCTLAESPAQALPFLRDRLGAPRQTPALTGLIGELNSDRFAVRERAMKKLEALGEEAAPALRQILAGKASEELRRRVEILLSRLPGSAGTRPVGFVRVCAVLERIGTAEARRLLEALARTEPEAWAAREARESLARLSAGKMP